MTSSLKNGTFIAFGNLETCFPRMVNIVIAAIPYFPTPIYIQAGVNFELFKSSSNLLNVFDYCNSNEFSKYTTTAQIIICHAGVGAISSALQNQKIPYIIPRKKIFKEHVDDHQLELAKLLRQNNLVNVIETSLDLINLLKNPTSTTENDLNWNFFINKELITEIQSYIMSQIQIHRNETQ